MNTTQRNSYIFRKQFIVLTISILISISGCSSVSSKSSATPTSSTSEHIEEKPSKETDDTYKTFGTVVLGVVILLLSNPKFE